MDYINAIINYYGCFSSWRVSNSEKEQKVVINISGKINKRSFISFTLMGFIGFSFILISDFRIITMLYMLSYIITIILILIKSKIIYNKLESKPKNINIYERELPSNLKPAHVIMIINDRLIDEISLYATLVDLIDRDILKF